MILPSKKIHNELLFSKAHYRAIIEKAYDAIIVTDETGNIIEWNQGAQKIFYYSENEVINKPITILMPERFRQLHLTGFKNAVKNGKLSSNRGVVKIEGLRKDGNEFPIELSLSCWVTDVGTFFLAIIRAISNPSKNDLSDYIRTGV